MSEYGLLLPFDTDDEAFTRGFEAGHVWTVMSQASASAETDWHETFSVHVENAEMMLRIAERLQLAVRSKELGDGWLDVAFAADSEALPEETAA